jgi:hypothetical protein
MAATRVEVRVAGRPPHDARLVTLGPTQGWYDFLKAVEAAVGPVDQVRGRVGRPGGGRAPARRSAARPAPSF